MKEYERIQRLLQLLLVWLVPFAGAAACHIFLRNQRAKTPREDFKFVRQTENDAGPMDSD